MKSFWDGVTPKEVEALVKHHKQTADTGSKHTPGPWKRRSIPGHLFELASESDEPVLRIRGGMMPTLADARLLAAAPELLMALHELHDYLREHGSVKDTLDILARSHEVLAKAEGRAEP